MRELLSPCFRVLRNLWTGLFVLLLVCGSARSQGGQATPCSVPLNPPTIALAAEVAHSFGQKVSCLVVDDLPGYWAVFRQEPDGSTLGHPLILLARNRGESEDEIVHELLHLQLQAETGIRQYVPPRPPEGVGATYDDDLDALWDAIAHVVIYPKMRAMGFDPAKKERDTTRSLLADSLQRWSRESPAVRSVRYAALATYIEDRALLEKVEAAYEKNGWDSDVTRGRRLARTFQSADWSAPSARAEVMVAGMNILFGTNFENRWIVRVGVLYLAGSAREEKGPK